MAKTDDFVPPERGPHAIQPRRVRKGHADEHFLSDFRYEAPREDPDFPEVYLYTDRISYDPGEEVCFRGSTTAETWSLQIYRDGHKPETLHEAKDLPGSFTPMPERAYAEGCGWPVLHRLTLPKDLRSGFYRVVASCLRPDGQRFVQHHFFVVRPTAETQQGRLLVLLATATWTSYNDWGGANHYFGSCGPERNQPSPTLSLERPWTRGMIWLPPGAQRTTQDPGPEFGTPSRYMSKEWGYSQGWGQYYAAAGWAQFDRHLVTWAEREGYALDIITQTDLHYRPEILERYGCLATSGHDEYWSWEMRDAVEAFVERGGGFTRFGGNFLWQIRLEQEGRVQQCWKFKAPSEDPLRDSDQSHRLTASWESAVVDRPGASTVGVNGCYGMYASWGGFAPRGSRGFTVYRPDHWVFDGTGLRYADVFGAEAGIFGYEVDGLDYTFHRGLPYAVPAPGVPDNIEILAMTPAVLFEGETEGEGTQYYIRDSDLAGLAALAPDGEAAARERFKYGSGMVVSMKRGAGEVLTAGSCEWVMGLTRNDPFTMAITRNALNRFLEP
ncbi:MAG: hypothetical protein Kilf2KO_05190 [Rhodospirillales bacterium]